MDKPQFRKLCSKVAKKYHWSRRNYSPPELRIKKILEGRGLEEGKDFLHNARIAWSNRTSYYPDFLIWRRFIVEYSPAVWHELYWDTERKFEVKRRRLRKLGYRVFTIKREEEIEKRMEEILALISI